MRAVCRKNRASAFLSIGNILHFLRRVVRDAFAAQHDRGRNRRSGEVVDVELHASEGLIAFCKALKVRLASPNQPRLVRYWVSLF
jgi:hypothetical protein